MKFPGIFGLAGVAVLFATASVHADTLASYPFTNSSPASTDGDTSSTASAISLGSGLTDTTRFATGFGNSAPSLRINTDETTGTSFLSAGVAGDDFGFSITPTAGDVLELGAVTFDLAVSNAAVVSNILVQYSSTNLAASYTSLTPTITGFSTTTFTSESFDLSAANTLLTAGAPIYVRFIVYDNANNANAYTAFDNITVTGTSTPLLVPEPDTYTLLALGVAGAAGVVLRRRRAVV